MTEAISQYRQESQIRMVGTGYFRHSLLWQAWGLASVYGRERKDVGHGISHATACTIPCTTLKKYVTKIAEAPTKGNGAFAMSV